ncbi:NAD(P)H-hydrate dehydratase [Roseococcus sp. SDR]|uniref:NAD(P)H-hydrate dehydratase n=1 Tax=Roseococcus sp. SDR TaxID=2835532 RepID=UPI001BCD246B|nr:NAD(P)H-hydrate dehydratase [Roseococcus sp. SDR]MBS7790531.1 NAD(P)H-hydrate dehydratase [Roseococcus sp. SDR]MBV1845845.1 NAD(P)H-hydrate dehydratase [Roseococcus sp. SDR]
MTPNPAIPPELLTPAEMAEADRLAGNGPALMDAAGRAVAVAIRRRFRPCRVLVLAGPGNNGGDGYVAARLLERAGWDVGVAALAPPRGDAALAAAAWRGPMRPFAAAEVARAGLLVDALFGAGLSRPLDGPAAELLAAAQAPIVAVDVPSGVCGATGAVRGFAARAALTVGFFRAKPGHLLRPGRDLCGELVLADIGLPADVLRSIRPRCFANGPALWRLPRPDAASHKHSRGHVTIISGTEMAGAALLAARAARRIGAGLVTLACADGSSALLHRLAEPGALVIQAAGMQDLLGALLDDPKRQVILLGPGLPPDATTRGAVVGLLAAGRRLVLDAGALTACEGQSEALRGAAILTPHEGEFARLFGAPGADRLTAAREAARSTGAVVLLKGSDSVIAAPDGRAAINHNAPPTLATGGSGDVLAGLAASLLAQGMEPFEAACAAAWLQGEAARLHGPGLLAEDLPEAAMRAAISLGE